MTFYRIFGQVSECLGFNGEVTGVWALWRRVEARMVRRWEVLGREGEGSVACATLMAEDGTVRVRVRV